MALFPTSLGFLQLNASFSSFLPPKRAIFTSPQGHGFGCVCLQKTWTSPPSMFLTTKPAIKDGVLSINGKDALTNVPDNVVVTPLSNSSAFVGATSTLPDCRHVFRLGLIQDIRLLCLFRFKLWWMIPRMGNSGRDIPIETQMLLLEAKEEPDEPASYILFLPVLDGEFRSSLQGNPSNELELCIESGDPAIVTSRSLKAVFVNYGDNPFDLMNESMKILEKHLGTFSLRETKQTPGILDCFGWCTWDAFYHKVNPQGIREGLNSLSEGGTPARFLIIDDGWQDTTNEFQKEGEPFIEGSQFGARLVSIKENNKFRETANKDLNGAPSGLKDFVTDIKRTFGLRFVYVWHALLGYWGGFHPDAPEARKYNPELKFPLQSPGNLANMRDISMDCMEKYGIGAIDPAKASEFYNDLHGYLVSQNVDGVKVDVQNILETLATGSGGRVSLTRHFQQALEESIAANFHDNSIICCMGLSTDTLYSTRRSAITRASDDYYPTIPTTQSLHIAAVAFNSIFLGEVVVPDWDMFYSLHNAAEFHAIARAVGGCGVYVSDKPGQHDFNILRRLVLPDGSVLRAKYPGRPSRDCLFNDPVMDGKSLLKIWNLNKVTGVIGIFNCQGAGSWPCLDNPVQKDVSSILSGQVSPADIEYFEEVAPLPWTGDCAVFSFKTARTQPPYESKQIPIDQESALIQFVTADTQLLNYGGVIRSLSRLPRKASFDVKLKILECDVFTVSPIKVYHGKVHFAAIGLIDMYNSGGSVEVVETVGGSDHSDNGGISMKGRGAGRFGAYSNEKPKLCSVNSEQVAFIFNDDDNFLTIPIPSGTNFWEIVVSY